MPRLTLALFGLLAIATPLPAPAAQPQAREAPKPLYRDPIHDGAADPVLVWHPTQKKWFMFYTNRRADLAASKGVAWVHGTRIAIAESPDGVAWKYRGTVAIPYGAEDYTHWAPDVFESEGAWHMFLSIAPASSPIGTRPAKSSTSPAAISPTGSSKASTVEARAAQSRRQRQGGLEEVYPAVGSMASLCETHASIAARAFCGQASEVEAGCGKAARPVLSGECSVRGIPTGTNADRLTQVTQGTSTVMLEYDPADRRTKTTLPNGVSMGYTYDDAGQLTKIEFARTGLPQAVSSAVYDAANRLTSWNGTHRGSAILPSHTPSAFGHVLSIDCTSQIDSPVWDSN